MTAVMLASVAASTALLAAAAHAVARPKRGVNGGFPAGADRTTVLHSLSTVGMLMTSTLRCVNRMPATPDFANEVAASRTYLLRFARLQLRNDAWAQDVVSETMLAALEKPDSFGGRSSLKTWLVGILKFKIIDCIRINSREVAATANFDEDAELEDLLFVPDGHFRDDAAEWHDPESSLSSKQFLTVMDVCISDMPPTMGRVFLMREWMEFTTDEICTELTTSPANVWVLLHRARLRLRECLHHKWFVTRTTEGAR